MANQGSERLGKHYDRDHLTYGEVRGPGLRAVTGDGDPVPREEFRGEVFRFASRDAAGGYLVESTEKTGQSTTLTDLRRV